MKSFKSGRIVRQAYYNCFIPNKINQEWIIDDPLVNDLLSKADQAIGRLDSFSDFIPNINLFISMHVAKEATQSTKIEGTQTNIEDVFQPRENLPQEKRDDWDEVQNYIKALDFATQEMKQFPFSSRLIRNIHEQLIQGVRGKDKLPGTFRTSQNWIGGATINDAKFVPPVHTEIPELMSDLEKFANNTAIHVPDLIRIALIHYQFETIHPFLDGNGRIGRILIPIYLEQKGILKCPTLYLSDFFEKNRQLYYDNLMKVRTDNDIVQWIKFFLVGITDVSNNSIETFQKIIQLKKETDDKLLRLKGKALDANKVMERLYQSPIIDVMGVQSAIGKSQASAYNLLKELEGLQILAKIGSRKKQDYVFRDYLSLFL
ncbi:MAG: Fic family protein [Rikenellaceae bacterium]|jgi:Fic family protein|nr:Fic family protein [Rikenellaceae bacterium]